MEGAVAAGREHVSLESQDAVGSDGKISPEIELDAGEAEITTGHGAVGVGGELKKSAPAGEEDRVPRVPIQADPKAGEHPAPAAREIARVEDPAGLDLLHRHLLEVILKAGEKIAQHPPL